MNAPNSKLVPPPTWNRPGTEWLTVAIFFIALTGFGLSTLYALHAPYWTWPLFICINSACVYSSFTVVHEASHRNISRDFPRFEYFLGLMTGLIFFHGSFDQFVGIHLRHHTKVNQAGLDPDLHAQGPLTLLRLLSWGVTIMIYSKFYWEKGLHRKERTLPMLFVYVALFGIYILAFRYGFMTALLALWTLPCMIGVMFTIYVFDHLPHRPHNDPGKYTNAAMYPHRGLDWVMFMQSHHLIHHLWPSVPWYRYRECYQQRRQELLAAGAIVIDASSQ